MTNAERARYIRGLYPDMTVPEIARFMRDMDGVTYSRQAVAAALKARSSKRGPRPRAPRCVTCGALPCHAKKST